MSILQALASGGGSLITDDVAFFNATGITDGTQQAAITQLIADLKTAGIWTKMHAIYPCIGGTAITHKYNLKNPVDSDAAFRGVFVGGVTHDANGITPNGTTGYMDTKLNGFVQGLDASSHMSVYVRTNTAAGDKTEMSAYDAGVRFWCIKARDTSDTTFNGLYRFNTDSFILVNGNTDARGFYVATRRSQTDAESYKNGVSTGTTTATSSQTIPSTNVIIGMRGDLVSSWTDRNIAYASIGTGLTLAEQLAEYVAVRRYQEALSRGLGSAFADNFNDNSIDPLLWTKTNSADITITESSSQINFVSDASYSGSLNIANLVSIPNFNFVGRKVEVDVVTKGLGGSAAISSGMALYVRDKANSNNYAAIMIDQNAYDFTRSNNGTTSHQTTGGSVASDTKWRIQHVAATNTWEFWTFNGSWSLIFTSAAANWNASNVEVLLQAYIYGTNSINKTTTYDNLTTDALYV